MKSRIISLLIIALYCSPTTAIDPPLTSAVIAQTAMLKSVHKRRVRYQDKIIKAELAITAAMTEIHKVENKILDYLSNAQGAMQNLYQIKRAAELTTIEIPRNIKLVSQSIPGHIKGTIIATIVSDELKDATAEAASLYPLIAQLVTSGSYNVNEIDGTTRKKKVNLLDAAERYYIANEVVRKLESINLNLYLLAWQIRTYTLNDLFLRITPETWANYMSGKSIVKGIIEDYRILLKS